MVERPDRLDPLRRLEKTSRREDPLPSLDLLNLLWKRRPQQPSPSTKPGGVSPIELAQNPSPLTQGPSFDSLLQQTKSVQGLLGDVNTHLQTKNLKLKQSDRASLRSKLTSANSYLKAANVKMAREVTEESTPQGGGILGKFLGYVTQGQANVAAAQKQLMDLKGKGDALKPADFLAIQVKLAHAQQEIEYASMMLANAVSGLKTLFNIQL
jgi:hypothetical protein